MTKILCISVLAIGAAAADPAHYVNFVRQIQSDSLVEWDVSVAPSGSMLSPEGVGPSGSLFQLWSIHNRTAGEYHLDEEFVSAYTPEATITIRTGDPCELLARTRVDQPFSVEIGISGLLARLLSGDLLAPATQVLLTHAAGRYPSGQHFFDQPAGEDPAGESDGSESPSDEIASATIDKDGVIVLNYPVTNLTGPVATKIEGEEVWTVLALETGVSGDPLIVGEVLDKATLQIWPIADATISGVDPEEKYDDLPPLTVSLRDLYPDSTTWLRVFAGSPEAPSGEPTDIQDSYVIIEDSIPRDKILTLDDLGDYFPKAGTYTLEVLHRTPFGTEVLTQFYPLNIERSILVRGSIYTAK